MIYGTHNSLTSYNTYGYCKLFKHIGNLFSKCQSKTIEEQYKSGIRWFNFQINYKDGKWLGSHGAMLYDVDAFEKLKWLNEQGEKIYVQFSLDKNFFIKYNQELQEEYDSFINEVSIACQNISIESIANEYTGDLNRLMVVPASREIYWSMSWAQNQGKKYWYLLPIPCLWSKHSTKDIDLNDPFRYYMIDFA